MSVKQYFLGDGVEGLFVQSDRFKTTLISVNFFIPTNKQTVAADALLPFILTSSSKDYPDFSALNIKLAELYGAQLGASIEKFGDCRLLRTSISVIDDSFVRDSASLVKQACDMLLGMIFEPKTENGGFCETDLAREKRKAIEHIKGEYSEKRIYAKSRMIEEMFGDTPYGLPKCGTVEQVESVDGKQLFECWQKMLESAYVRVQVIGSSLPDGLFEKISERFSRIKRKDIANCKTSLPILPANEVKYVNETDNVNQCKLCMGFSSDIFGDDDVTMPLVIMSDIFGGGPYSKLFSNVREKMSLCYYCSSSVVKNKALLTVDSGVEATNIEKAESEILNQLDMMKKGDFDDFQFEASKKSITNSLKTYNDNAATLDTWYLLKIANKTVCTPEEFGEKIAPVTKEDVIKAANGIKLHTVYKLLPKEKTK